MKNTNEPMRIAIQQGLLAYSKQEIPIGAVIVKNGKIIAKSYNDREKSKIATRHAEIISIDKVCKKLKSWRLDDCELYVTKEPCPMCAGAIVNARIKRVYFAVKDTENGGISRFDILNNSMNHTTEAVYLEEYEPECKGLLQDFFKTKRDTKNN